MKKLGMLLLTGILATGLAACSGNSAAPESFPTKNIEIIAPASPGGGWDITARSVQKVLQDNDLIENNINVMNKPGGGGEVGFKYIESKDGHYVSINSSLLLTNNLLGQSQLTHENFTPLATLATEWQSIAVSPDSKYQTATELFEQLKKDPKSINVGVGPALGNDDHLAFVQAATSYGVDPSQLNFLVYEGGGDVVTALLGGHVDVITTSVSDVKDQHLAGKLKIVAVSSEERIAGLDDVPTYQEEGVDMVFPHWRGIMGPPDMTEEEVAYWDEALSAMVQTEDWQKILENNDWEDYYMNSEEAAAFFVEQEELYTKLVNDSGLVK